MTEDSFHQRCRSLQTPDQVNGDQRSNQEAHVHVRRMAAVLSDLGQARQRRCNGEGKHQDRFQQFGAVGDAGVQIDLRGTRGVMRTGQSGGDQNAKS